MYGFQEQESYVRQLSISVLSHLNNQLKLLRVEMPCLSDVCLFAFNLLDKNLLKILNQ